jgi:3-isopropylmalate/(R)-2-methylmalate dehydratase small subunit
VRAFTVVTSHAAVLDRADVDTDQIVPKQFLKRIERTGFGEFLFHDWRRDPGFELNRPEYAGARILLAGRNFGCGSSREHAAWALQDAGFDAVVAPSFGDIFYANALKIGLLAVVLPAEQVRALMAAGGEVTVDLEEQTVSGGGETYPFAIDPFARHRLLNGLDEIALTLAHGDAITEYERANVGAVDTVALP